MKKDKQTLLKELRKIRVQVYNHQGEIEEVIDTEYVEFLKEFIEKYLK